MDYDHVFYSIHFAKDSTKVFSSIHFTKDIPRDLYLSRLGVNLLKKVVPRTTRSVEESKADQLRPGFQRCRKISINEET